MELPFVDDLLIFTKLDLHSVLLDLVAPSGLNINKAKSVLYMAGVSVEVENNILEAIAIPKGSLPFRYFGFPFFDKRLGIKDSLPVVKKIIARLNHWVTEKLSMVS